jgi:hypothetical protein
VADGLGTAAGSSEGATVGSALGATGRTADGVAEGSALGATVGSALGGGVDGSTIGAGVGLGVGLGLRAATGATTTSEATRNRVWTATNRRMAARPPRIVGLNMGLPLSRHCWAVPAAVRRWAGLELRIKKPADVGRSQRGLPSKLGERARVDAARPTRLAGRSHKDA